MTPKQEEAREQAIEQMYARRGVEDEALRMGEELRDTLARKRANMDQIEALIASKPKNVTVVSLAQALKMSRQEVYTIKQQEWRRQAEDPR